MTVKVENAVEPRSEYSSLSYNVYSNLHWINADEGNLYRGIKGSWWTRLLIPKSNASPSGNPNGFWFWVPYTNNHTAHFSRCGLTMAINQLLWTWLVLVRITLRFILVLRWMHYSSIMSRNENTFCISNSVAHVIECMLSGKNKESALNSWKYWRWKWFPTTHDQYHPSLISQQQCPCPLINNTNQAKPMSKGNLWLHVEYHYQKRQ